MTDVEKINELVQTCKDTDEMKINKLKNEIKDPSKSTLHYRTSAEVARDNYCDTLMEFLSDVNFINPPSIEE